MVNEVKIIMDIFAIITMKYNDNEYDNNILKINLKNIESKEIIPILKIFKFFNKSSDDIVYISIYNIQQLYNILNDKNFVFKCLNNSESSEGFAFKLIYNKCFVKTNYVLNTLLYLKKPDRSFMCIDYNYILENINQNGFILNNNDLTCSLKLLDYVGYIKIINKNMRLVILFNMNNIKQYLRLNNVDEFWKKFIICINER